MSGSVKQFLDYSNNTNNDTGANSASSIQPITDGNPANATNLGRPDESLRQRTEAVKNVAGETLYLRDADRTLVISGPGKITWPGSTTASASGIPVLNDTLWILPMITPGFAQTAPVPPVASAFGKIHLQRQTGPINAIAVSSLRRSYAAGDQINITVTSGASFSCTLSADSTYQRTISIVAVSGTTTLSTVISALNALTPSAVGDNTPIVSAALEGGALGSDFLLVPQAKRYMAGNYDGEGHSITPANLAAFFSGNPSSALAEGDTLCVHYDMITDTASTGGRRQSIPENSNTTIPVGSFFNSRVNPELLVNALPICKVINGSLVFATGAEVPAGSVNVALATVDQGSKIIRNGGFEHANALDTTRYGISHWENRTDLAVNGAFRANTTSPHIGGKQLEFNQTSPAAATGRIEQNVELPVVVGQVIRIVAFVKQLIAPTAGTYSINLYWGDSTSTASGSSVVNFQVLSTTDASYRAVDQSITVPSGKSFLKTVTIEVAGVTLGSSGVSVLVDDVQVFVASQAYEATPIDDTRMATRTLDALLLEDPSTYSLGQLAALLRFTKASPTNEGTLTLDRKDQTYDNTHMAPVLALLGRLLSLGSKTLGTSANALLPRIQAPVSVAGGATYTLLFESPRDGESPGSYTQPITRFYLKPGGGLAITLNALWGGSTWSKDVNGIAAAELLIQQDQLSYYAQDPTVNTPWAEFAWTYQPVYVYGPTNTPALFGNIQLVGNTLIQGSNSAPAVTVSTLKAGTGLALPLMDVQGYDSRSTVLFDHVGRLYRKGAYWYDEFHHFNDTSADPDQDWSISGGSAALNGLSSPTFATEVPHLVFLTPTAGTVGASSQINRLNYAAYRKNFPRFSARVRTFNLNKNLILGDAARVAIGYSTLYLDYDQTVHSNLTHWYLNVDGTFYDTGLTSNLDGGTGLSAGQIVSFAVIATNQVLVTIHDQNDTWATASQAVITTSTIGTGARQPLAFIVNSLGTSPAPQFLIDYMESAECARFD